MIPRLEDLSPLKRAIVAIVIVLVVILALFVAGMLSVEGEERPDLYEGVPLDAALLQLDRRALDEAYHAQVILLFQTWLKQQAGDATYFRNGLKLARRAYHQASEQIEKRQRMIEEQQRK